VAIYGGWFLAKSHKSPKITPHIWGLPRELPESLNFKTKNEDGQKPPSFFVEKPTLSAPISIRNAKCYFAHIRIGQFGKLPYEGIDQLIVFYPDF
jgi:hypothetical protein